VDFTLTEEQALLRDSVRSLLTNECPPSLVRAHVDDPAASDVLFDRHLREWVALGDGPLVDLALFCQEAGRVLLPGPHLATTALFLPLLRAADLQAEADRAAAGELVGTVALAGRDGRWVVDPVSDDPVRTFVPEADRVDVVAVVVPGPAVVLVDAPPTGLRHVSTLDTTRRVFEVDVPSGSDAAGTPIAVEDLAAVVAGATVAVAAELVGVARWLLEASVAYAKERIQFDVPVGSFQGLQWELVDMALDVERADAAVAYAAMAVDAGDPDRFRAVPVAKAAAGEAARHCAKVGMQVHGGIGYTWEHDLHLYLRRAYAGDAFLGDAAWQHDRLAELLFDQV